MDKSSEAVASPCLFQVAAVRAELLPSRQTQWRLEEDASHTFTVVSTEAVMQRPS